MFRQELLGTEYDWLAIDSHGHVGWFCTAGGGLAPTDIVARIAEHDAAIESIENLVPITTALEGAGDHEWTRGAVRGLFVFDSGVHGEPYKRVATPVVPVVIGDLPALFAIARRLQIRGDFRELAIIPTQLIDELG